MPEVEIRLPKYHPKQQLAFDSEATDLLFGGATRGGKSYFVRRALIIWCSQIPGLQCDIFRLHFDDVLKENMMGETGFYSLLNNWNKAGLCKINQAYIEFWNGSAIYLEHCADDKVMLKHQGIARHVRVFSEATQISERRIKWLSAWVTMSEEMKSRVPDKWKGRFPKIIHVTNPIGVSAPYYKREYVKPHKPYTIFDIAGRKRQYIPALVSDNPSEDAEQTKARVMGMGDTAIGRALLEADWDAITGEFFSEWSEQRHVVADCYPPPYWYRYRAYDWGTADPSACIFVAISDGQSFVDDNGKDRWFPRGALLVYKELYFCDKNDPSKGARMRNEDMARAILENSEYEHRNLITLTDSKPFQDMGGVSIAQTFATEGVNLTMADTSRIPGWSQVRSRLIGKTIDTFSPRVPMIFFCERCTFCRDYIPALTRHKSESKVEDATENGEATHICDAIRYACQAHSNNVIRDRLEPMEGLVKRSLSERNTMRDITGGII